MKLAQSCLIALFAAMSFAFLPSEPARADHLRWMIPGYFPPPPERRVYRYYPDPYEDEFYEDDFYNDDDEAYFYDEDEPRYDRKPRKKKRSTASAAPDDVTPAPAQKSKKKKQSKTAATQTETAATQTESRPKPKKVATTGTATGAPTGNLTCDKAKSIVSGYGFADIQTQSCSGQVYSFAAKRGGKSFAVKVSALNGELTEVKRQ